MCVRYPSTPGARMGAFGIRVAKPPDVDRPVAADHRPHGRARARGEARGDADRGQQGREEGPEAPSRGHRGTVSTARRRRPPGVGCERRRARARVGGRRRGRTRSAERAEPTSRRARQAGRPTPARRRGHGRERRVDAMDLDLGQLRKQAKELVRAARAGDPEALARLGGREPILARAQLVLAREHGLRELAGARGRGGGDRGRVRPAPRPTGRRARAEALLAARPAIERDPWARARPRPRLGRRPVRARRAARLGAAALRLPLRASRRPRSRASCSRAARTRTRPSATSTATMSALYGAAGVVARPRAHARAAGGGRRPRRRRVALPRDRRAETRPACACCSSTARPRRARTRSPHALDEERPEHVRLLLDAGADPGEGALVAHAVRRGRGPDVARAARRARRRRRPARRRDVARRRPAAHALPARRAARARRPGARRCAELGAATEVDPADRAARARSRAASGPTAPLPEPLDVDAQEVAGPGRACAATWSRSSAAVGPRFRGVVGGSPEGALLHHAAWVGAAGVARALLAAGADPRARADAELATPLGWAALSSRDGRPREPTTWRSPSCSSRPARRSSRRWSTSPTGRWRPGWRSTCPDRPLGGSNVRPAPL